MNTLKELINSIPEDITMMSETFETLVEINVEDVIVKRELLTHLRCINAAVEKIKRATAALLQKPRVQMVLNEEPIPDPDLVVWDLVIEPVILERIIRQVMAELKDLKI
jgi:hypothetical protein